MSSTTHESRLEYAVRDWIKAEYAFRFGRNCYSREAQERLVMAEDLLRKARTGKHSLVRAAKKLGVKVGRDQRALDKAHAKGGPMPGAAGEQMDLFGQGKPDHLRRRGR